MIYIQNGNDHPILAIYMTKYISKVCTCTMCAQNSKYLPDGYVNFFRSLN